MVVNPTQETTTAAGGTPRAARWMAGLNLVLLGLLAVALGAYLWPQWSHNPDLSHGLFMPVVFLLLLWEARTHAPRRHPPASAAVLFGVAVLAVASLGFLTMAGMFAVSLGWSQSLVAFVLTAALLAALLAGFLAVSVDPLRWLPLTWVVFCAAFLWLLTAPIPPGTYTRLTLGLQSWVTGHVLTALHILGVAARQRGNLIDLAGTTVGIEEACSGIRSLLACVYAGFFFSAILVRRPWARAVLVVLAPVLAIFMNFVRSLTLTLLANDGVDINGFWHDATGYAILGVTAVLLAGLALLLDHRRRAPRPPAPRRPARASSRPVLLASQAVLTACLTIGGAITLFFVVHTRPLRPGGPPPPDLAAILPSTSPGWRVVSTRDLYRFSDTLHTNDLVQRTYLKGTGDDFTQVTVYLAYWKPGQASVSAVSVHTPDACWPGVGWRPVPTPVRRFAPFVGGQKLPVAEHRLFTSEGYPQNVWFWHLYDGKPVVQRDPRSPLRLLAIAWQYGFRKSGDQLFIRVSSNRPWSAIASDPLLAEIFARLKPFGL